MAFRYTGHNAVGDEDTTNNDLSDTESTILMSAGMKKESQKPDWGRFGLSTEQQRESAQALARENPDGEEVFDHHTESEKNELFSEDQSARSKPWYKANFFISEPVLFGTWDGVFTSCMINIFGVVIFLRTGWMVGNAGIGLSVLMIFMTISVALISVLSAIGVCERCKMQSGGVYYLLSHVMGARIGASVGILYCFGQAVAVSLYVVGFGESVSALFNQEENVWVSRGIATGVVVLLLGINVAGVKWVIRLQLILLMVLFIAMLDFLVGSFVHTDIENGFVGYRGNILKNNTGPDYLDGETFFTVFGVFFPTATGVFAGINMSGDLRDATKNIPVGTLSAVGVSTLLYLIFAVVLGATCIRGHLQTEYLIAEKVSIVGFLFLAGLYISSISSSMGGLYGSPRVLQCIAQQNVIPIIKVLGKGVSWTGVLWSFGLYIVLLACGLSGMSEAMTFLESMARDQVIKRIEVLAEGRGPNKVPVYALIVVAIITLIFVFIGKVNTLGPIVTMPFMLTYAAVDYCYFCLAMSFDKRKAREDRFHSSVPGGVLPSKPDSNGTVQSPQQNYGAINSKKSSDLDKLFPERMEQRGQPLTRQDSLGSPTFYTDGAGGDIPGPGAEKGGKTEGTGGAGGQGEVDDTAGLLDKDGKEGQSTANTEILRQPRSFYSIFQNRWLSVLGALISLVIMFAIQWGYALANISVALIVYIYIGQANPGVFPGIAEFSLWEWIHDGVKNCCRKGPPPPEQIVVTPNTPAMSTMAAQLTEDNEDFAERGRYHQSEVVKGENFDDYDSN